MTYRPDQKDYVSLSWDQLTEGSSNLATDVIASLKELLLEFFTESGEVELPDAQLDEPAEEAEDIASEEIEISEETETVSADDSDDAEIGSLDHDETDVGEVKSQKVSLRKRLGIESS